LSTVPLAFLSNSAFCDALKLLVQSVNALPALPSQLKILRDAAAGILVANPPYGERLGDLEELAAFYPKLGEALKRRFAGWDCWFLSADTRLPKLVGLKPMRKIPLYNGPLECRLYGFRMVAGSNRQ